jgi:hypothetical protein
MDQDQIVLSQEPAKTVRGVVGERQREVSGAVGRV